MNKKHFSKNIKSLKSALKYQQIFNQYGHNFSRISKHSDLPEQFIEEYLSKLNLRLICKHSKLSEQFLTKHYNLLKLNYCTKIIKLYQPHLIELLESLDINEKQ